MNKEIVVPEGCKARIEGTKVILEPNESEDEKIRRYIVSFVELNKGVNLPPDEADKILAYLEKQKEQKPEIKYVYPIFRVGDTIKPKVYNESHRIKKIKDDNYVLDNEFTFPIVDQDVWEIVKQEQPEVDLDDEIDNFLYGTKFKRDCDGVHVPGVCMRDWKGKKYINRDVTPDDMRKFARHFAEWGAIHLNARK